LEHGGYADCGKRSKWLRRTLACRMGNTKGDVRARATIAAIAIGYKGTKTQRFTKSKNEATLKFDVRER